MLTSLHNCVLAAQFTTTMKCLNLILHVLFTLHIARWLALLGGLGSVLTMALAMWKIKGRWGFLNLGLIFFFITLATICFITQRLHIHCIVKQMVKEYLEWVNQHYSPLGLHLCLEKQFL